MRCLPVVAVIGLTALLLPEAQAGVRIKDITDFEGARSNQLYGFGLVVGLAGTGSTRLFTQQVVVDMLRKQSVGARIFTDLPSDNVIRSTNVSAVMVTAEIGPFSRRGSRLDVLVSALDDASSLQGGTLILTPLRGADGEVYAVAQGPLSVGGFAFGGVAANVQKNHPTVGRIAGGAIVEQEAHGDIVCHCQLHLLLKEPDYATARLIADAINEKFRCSAWPVDAGTVHVLLPKDRLLNPVGFATEIGLLEVTPDSPARVVINERTGTVVMGEQVKISTVAIAHGNLAVVKVEEPQVSQPPPFSPGQTTVVPRTSVGVTEQKGGLHVVDRTVTVGKLARALNALGVTPRDLISIFQTLKGAGALHAELVIQ
jgi:flagellar P-ring protein precursor FlgI